MIKTIERIEADMMRAAQAAEKYRRQGKHPQAARALGVADGLRQAASYMRADLAESPVLGALQAARGYLLEISEENPDHSEFIVSEAVVDLAKIDAAIAHLTKA